MFHLSVFARKMPLITAACFADWLPGSSPPASSHTAGVVAITEEQRSHSRRDHTGAKRRRTAQLFALLTPAKVLMHNCPCVELVVK